MSTPKSRNASYWLRLLNTRRRELQPWIPRTVIIVCENHREAREHYRLDREANREDLQQWSFGSLALTLRNGTTRRYFSGQEGPERVYGLECHEYFNLIRNLENFWRWEEVLWERNQRYLPAPEPEPEPTTWELIVEEWRIFLSRRIGRWATALTVIMIVLFLLWLTAPRLP